MAKKRILSLILTLFMMLSIIPYGAVFAEYTEAQKGQRSVYLHAQGENPQQTVNVSTVYMGDTVNLYFAVDDPNKGDYSNNEHLEPQYDMNGYTVKIYFDPIYFDYAQTTKTTSINPIDYTIPDRNLTNSGDGNDFDEESGEIVDDELIGEAPKDDTIGYYVYKHGSGSATVNGRQYKTAYATIFFSGTSLPNKKDGQLWYNICALPIVPLRTGSSDVFIEVGTADKYTLELFAKHVSDDYPPNFTFTAVNGGYHHITIKDKLKPAAPVADPISGSYTEAQKVTLTAEDDCRIYYSVDGGNSYALYTEPIDVERSAEIFCYAERISDGKVSNTVSYEYKIIPKAPYMFDSSYKRIANVYTDDEAFRVYISDKENFSNIADDSEVYYTYSDLTADELTTDGSDPQTQWVKVNKQMPYINVDQKRTVKLITVKASAYGEEKSDISWYYLAIKPAPVVANPDSGVYETKQEITLTTETDNAQIFYTTDGSDPRGAGGILYTIPLVLNKDTTVRAAALYDDTWSDATSYWYIFDLDDDYGVDAFYPSGVYEGSVNVTLTPNNPENNVIYSTDGGNTWNDYKDTIKLENDTEIIAKAVDKNGTEGEEYKFTYTIKPLPPVFAPESTQFTNTNSISIYCPETTAENTQRYELIYTTDGSDPITSPTAVIADAVSDSAQLSISDYTVVTAVVRRDKTTYSTVVSHSYDIVISKPVKPLTTLLPGYYTREIGSEPYTTQFVPAPTGTKIYYTIAYGDEIKPDPVPGVEGTFEYNGEDIEIKGKTIIKAVAVNSFGAKSDIGIFEYNITPQAPVAAPSATIGEKKLPFVPVDAVIGSTVKYKIGDFENSFVVKDDERFYIDTSTGNAYKDEAMTIPLGDKSDDTYTGRVMLEISAVLDGISSDENVYVYTAANDTTKLAPPYADKESGVYEEIKVGDNYVLLVGLYSLNDDDEIQYMTDNSGEWISYDGNPIGLKGDTVIQLRAKKGNVYSSVVSYVYEFVPVAPIITLPSGTYLENPVPSTMIVLDSRVPDEERNAYSYSIWFRANGLPTDQVYNNAPRTIEHTMSFKAYVVNDETGKKSANTIHYYIIESAHAVSGNVNVAFPYEVNPGDTRFIASHKLDDKDYNEGIKLYTQQQNVQIRYFYTYTKADGSGTAASETYTYDNATPIFVNSSMADIQITAWLVNKDGTPIDDSESTFNYVFVDLLVPKTSLAISNPDKTEYAKNTKYTIVNDYPNDETVILYYTTDGSDPSDSNNKNRKAYDGSELTIDGAVTVKTAYFKACGRCGACRDELFESCSEGVTSEVGTYNYTVPTVQVVGGGGGGGGGSKVIDNTRKYTVDIFGGEHPTHISYIKGYPDGSVQAEGDITREEMAAILHRINIKGYDEPYAATGKVFPDVGLERWSVIDIEYMAYKNVIVGYPSGEFMPQGHLTRAEFASLIRRFTKLDSNKAANKYSDLDEEHWAYDDILYLLGSGLMQGYEDSTFRPEDKITRAEVMTVMNKILGRCPSEAYVKSLNFNPFNDLEKNKWYYVTVLEATITHNYYLNASETLEYKWEDWK